MKKFLIVDDIENWINYHKEQVLTLIPDADIKTANSAKEGYDKLLENNSEPFDIIFTDLQMETDFEPKLAGEWFIEQIKTLKNYYNTKIVIISASYKIKNIAEFYNVDYIQKNTAINFPDVYKEIF